MSWAEEKAREAYLKFATNDWDMEMQGEALATVESAIRETIAKCAEVAVNVDLSKRHAGVYCSDEQAGGEALDIAAQAVRKLGEP